MVRWAYASLFVLLFASGDASAQKTPKPRPKPGRPAGGVIVFDAPRPPPPAPVEPPPPPRPPPYPQRLPAVALDAPAPLAIDRAAAERDWSLALALEGARFTVTAAAVLAPIASNPLHPRFNDAVVRLAKIARALLEGAEVERSFASVTPQVLSTVAQDPDGTSAAVYFMGRHRYFAGRYAEAADAFAWVDARDPLAARGRALAGAAYVRLHAGTRAIKAFQASLAALDLAPPSFDRTATRDVVLAALARTYLSGSIRHDEMGRPFVDSAKLSAATKFYLLLDPASGVWPEVARELAWTYFLAGEQIHALGIARAFSGAAFPSRYAAELGVMRAALFFFNCHYDEADEQSAAVERWAPVDAGLRALVATADRTGRDDAYFALAAAIQAGQMRVEPAVATIVLRALAERGVARRIAYVARIDAESVALARSPFASARGALDLERARVVRRIGVRIRNELIETGDSLARALEEAHSLAESAVAGKRNQIDASLLPSLVTIVESRWNLPRFARPTTDPFTRRLPDEVRYLETGYFLETVMSKCGR